MKDIELIGKTQKGKNRVRELGKRATIISTSQEVFFSNKKGPWAWIVPHERWINIREDDDFQIKEIEE